MTRCDYFIRALLLASILPPVQGLQEQRALPVATIHVDVVGPFGATVQFARVQLLSADRKRDLSAPQGGLIIANVPFGRYILIVSDQGGGLAEREVVVNAKEVWVRAGLSFPGGNRAWPGGDLTISGDLVPPPRNVKGWWVRIEGVFLHDSRESLILPSGQFSISGLEMGSYMVEVFEGNKLRHAETVEIDTRQPNTHLKISISNNLAR